MGTEKIVGIELAQPYTEQFAVCTKKDIHRALCSLADKSGTALCAIMPPFPPDIACYLLEIFAHELLEEIIGEIK